MASARIFESSNCCALTDDKATAAKSLSVCSSDRSGLFLAAGRFPKNFMASVRSAGQSPERFAHPLDRYPRTHGNFRLSRLCQSAAYLHLKTVVVLVQAVHDLTLDLA